MAEGFWWDLPLELQAAVPTRTRTRTRRKGKSMLAGIFLLHCAFGLVFKLFFFKVRILFFERQCAVPPPASGERTHSRISTLTCHCHRRLQAFYSEAPL